MCIFLCCLFVRLSVFSPVLLPNFKINGLEYSNLPARCKYPECCWRPPRLGAASITRCHVGKEARYNRLTDVCNTILSHSVDLY